MPQSDIVYSPQSRLAPATPRPDTYPLNFCPMKPIYKLKEFFISKGMIFREAIKPKMEWNQLGYVLNSYPNFYTFNTLVTVLCSTNFSITFLCFYMLFYGNKYVILHLTCGILFKGHCHIVSLNLLQQNTNLRHIKLVTKVRIQYQDSQQ